MGKSKKQQEESKAVTRILDGMRARFKDNTITVLSSGNAIWEPKHWIDTDVLAFQATLGAKGLPTGKIIEIQGYESAGKSTLVDQLMASFQRRGHMAVLIDTEYSRQASYMSKLGVDPEELIILQEHAIEGIGERIQGLLEEIEKVGHDQAVIIVWDTIANTPSRKEAEGYTERAKGGKGRGGLQEAARAIKEMFRAISRQLSESSAVLVCTNQWYNKIDRFGGRETYGGNAMKYMPSARIEVIRAGGKDGGLFDGETRIGHFGRMVANKNKIRDPFKETPFCLLYGSGFDNAYTAVELLKRGGFVEAKGAWLTLDVGHKSPIKAQGVLNLRTALLKGISEDPELWDAILDKAHDSSGTL